MSDDLYEDCYDRSLQDRPCLVDWPAQALSFDRDALSQKIISRCISERPVESKNPDILQACRAEAHGGEAKRGRAELFAE